MNSICTLYDQEKNLTETVLPRDLRARYGGDLYFPVAPGRTALRGRELRLDSGRGRQFRYFGPSRGCADQWLRSRRPFHHGFVTRFSGCRLVGAGTVEAVSPNHLWIAEFICPAASTAYARYRNEVIRKPSPYPLTVIVSGPGRLDLDRSVFHTSGVSVLIITSGEGRNRLLRGGVAALRSTQIRELPHAEGRIDPCAILRLLRNEFEVTLLLHEGGPTLFGHFLSAGLVDELFLTMAPQIAGRTNEHPRPGLVAHTQFAPDTAPWLVLVSAKQQSNHLYLRYRTSEKEEGHL